MNRQTIINRTIKAINQLPEDKAEEISNFANFLIKQHEENTLNKAMQHLADQGEAFQFLHDENEDIYSVDDIKIPYNG